MSPKHDFSSLTIEQACEGVRICIDNAKRLVEHSKLLIDESLLELATFVAITAIEEAGKALLLVEHKKERTRGRKEAFKKLGDSFCSHPEKYKSALKECVVFVELIEFINQAVNSENMSPEVASREFLKKMRRAKIPDKTTIFETRNEMLYTEFKDGKFSAPKDKGRKSQYDSLLCIANYCIAQAERLLTSSLKCIKTGLNEDPELTIEKSMTFIIESFKKANAVNKRSGPDRSLQ